MKKLIILVVCSMIAMSAAGQDLKPKQGKNGQWGYVNSKGSVVIDFKYDGADKFSQGLAAVKSGGKWGYINDKGETVIEFAYDGRSPFNGGLAGIKQDGKWGFINTKGSTVIAPRFEQVGLFGQIPAAEQSDAIISYDQWGNVLILKGKADIKLLAPVRIDGKWGYIDNKGDVVIDLSLIHI